MRLGLLHIFLPLVLLAGAGCTPDEGPALPAPAPGARIRVRPGSFSLPREGRGAPPSLRASGAIAQNTGRKARVLSDWVYADPDALGVPGGDIQVAESPKLPSAEPVGLASLSVKRLPVGRRVVRARRTVRFGVLSDLHKKTWCSPALGRWVPKAVEFLNGRSLDFVVLLGDLVASSGRCPNGQRVEDRLRVLEKVVVSRLRAPLIVVEGNHDIDGEDRKEIAAARQAWERFWLAHQDRVLPGIWQDGYRRSYRFTYGGWGFVVLGYYGTFGLHRKEWEAARELVRSADVVFRHVNLFGISCRRPGHCGFAIRNTALPDYDRLYRLMRERRISLLVSGHTHAFYYGVCSGIPFLNNGSLASRSMEYVRGWEDSPYRYRQELSLVTLRPGRLPEVEVFVSDSGCECFRKLSPDAFPDKVRVGRVRRFGFEEGVEAVCARPDAEGSADARGGQGQAGRASASAEVPAREPGTGVQARRPEALRKNSDTGSLPLDATVQSKELP